MPARAKPSSGSSGAASAKGREGHDPVAPVRAVSFGEVGHAEHGLRRALHHRDPSGLGGENRHLAPAVLGEGNDRLDRAGEARRRGPEQPVERVAAVVARGGRGKHEKPGAVDALGRHRLAERQPALGQGAGLVGADAGDAADILDHDGAAHQRLVAGKPVDADAEKEAEDDGKFLRQRRDGEGHGAEDRIREPVALLIAQDRERDAERQRRGDKDLREPAHRGLQRRAIAAGDLGEPRDLAVKRACPGLDDPHPRGAGQEPGARHAPVDAVDAAILAQGRVEYPLAHRQRFARQGRFVGLQVGARDKDPVAGEVAARRDAHEVAGDEILGGDLGLRPVPDDEGARGDAAAQALGRGLGAAVKPGIHPDDGEECQAEDRRLAIIAEPAEKHRRRGEEPDHRVGDGVAHDLAPSRGSAGDDGIGAVAGTPPGNLGGRQAARGVVEPLQPVDRHVTQHLKPPIRTVAARLADPAPEGRGRARPGAGPGRARQLFGSSAGMMVTIAGNIQRITRPSTWISTKGTMPR